MDAFNLGKPIAGGGGGLVGHTVPLSGFDQGEHGAGTGVSGGHVPSAANQARGYGQDDSNFNHGVGGEHASGGLSSKTPIADKFTGGQSHGHSHGHSHPSEAVSGSYAGGGTRDALTGESNAHTTGAGVGKLAENLNPSSHSGSHDHNLPAGASAGGYGGSINRTAESGHHTGSARDAALTATAGAAAASALAPTAGSHGHSHETGTGVGAAGGSGGHYSTSGHGSTTGQTGQNLNIGTGASAGVLAGQQAGARGTHGDSGITGSHGSSAATGAGVGSGVGGASGHKSSSHDSNERGTPLSNPKDLDSGSRHGLVFNESTGKYVHRHELEERK